jgi:hypothetical protein
MLRVQRSTDGRNVVLALSGRIGAEDVKELESLFQDEIRNYHLVLDLKDVKLVNREAVKFLGRYEVDGARLRNCPPYIREWITREREASDKFTGEEPRGS